MYFWKQKKSSLIAVLPAASREAGRVVTSEEAPVTPAQRRSRLLRAFKPGQAQEEQKSYLPRRDSSKQVDGNWAAILIMGLLLLFNSAVNGWLLWKVDQKDPAHLVQRIQIEQAQAELSLLKRQSEAFLRDSRSRMNTLQLDFASAQDQLQILEHEKRQTLRAYQKPPVYGLNGVVVQTGVPQ